MSDLAYEPNPARHVSIEKGDILHIGQEQYIVVGWVALGMPIREMTLNLEPWS